MKKILLSIITVFSISFGLAQSDLIAVSGTQEAKIDFQDFRFINLKNNSENVIATKNAEIPDQVVGMTYDAKNQHLIFVGMYTPDVYSYDFNTARYSRIYTAGRAFSKCALSEQFSRMATNSDGISYALNNSSQELIEVRPTLSGYAVKELGALNSDINLDQYKFYGGDLIANDNGELFLISANRQVVKINPSTLKATYVGGIKGIEKNYTTNGSAVMANGQVLLSNATGKGLYTLDFNTLEAKPFGNKYNTAIYDLASPYFLQSSGQQNEKVNSIKVYPSKITNREVTVSILSDLTGMGRVAIYDVAGNSLLQTSIVLSVKGAVKKLVLNHLKPGNYYLKVIDGSGIELKNEKIILLR